MRRRRVLELAALAAGDGVVLTSAAAGGLALGACHSRGAPAVERSPSWTPAFFSRAQALCTEALAELMLPEGSLPGAKSAGVAPFIESCVRDVYEEPQQRAFIDALDGLETRAMQAHGRPFWACAAAKQAALFSALGSEPAPRFAPSFSFVRSFRELCIRGFCCSKLGATRVLQYDPTPGEFQGCVDLESVGKAWATW